MPATMIVEPLSVRFGFPNGTTWTADLAGLPNPQLAADLARGLPYLTHPLGGIATRATATSYIVALRCMVRELADAGFAGGAAELTRPALIQYWLTVPCWRERLTRGLLAGFDSVGGLLDVQVREHLRGRALKLRPASTPLAPYTEREWTVLTDRCQTIIDTAWQAHRAMRRAADRAGDPRGAGLLTEGGVAWLLAEHGPMGQAAIAGSTGFTLHAVRQVGVVRAATALFPTGDVALAYQLLFGIYTGIVPDGIAGLGLAGIDWAGDATVLLDYVKGRAGRQSLTLPRPAVRLLERWLEHSALLRSHAPDTLRSTLWLKISRSLTRNPERRIDFATPLRINTTLAHRWVAEHDVTVDGVPIPIHRARIRTTYQNLLSRRGWTGRTTIDPNHSAAVEGDHYLSVTTPAQQDAIDAIIEDGQADLLRKAAPPTVLTDQQAADIAVNAAAAFPQLVADHGLDQDAITELLGGERDVFVAACANQLASPFGPAGKPCPARPWVCLLCPLAVFLPRHLPNLARLKGFFSRQFRQQPTAAFLAVFGPYATRLDTEILPRFNPDLVADAAHQVETEHTEPFPLRPEELA